VIAEDECDRGGAGRWYYGVSGRTLGIGTKATGGSFDRFPGFDRGGFGRKFRPAVRLRLRRLNAPGDVYTAAGVAGDGRVAGPDVCRHERWQR
jgi:hypothetical protein